jgi:cold shock CspA family protein
MRYIGTVTKWQDERGFGFITPEGGGESVFVHISAFSRGQRRPVGGEKVTYVLSTDEKGRPRAQQVNHQVKSVKERVPTFWASPFWRTDSQ